MYIIILIVNFTNFFFELSSSPIFFHQRVTTIIPLSNWTAISREMCNCGNNNIESRWARHKSGKKIVNWIENFYLAFLLLQFKLTSFQVGSYEMSHFNLWGLCVLSFDRLPKWAESLRAIYRKWQKSFSFFFLNLNRHLWE